MDAILSFERGVSASYTGTMVARGLATPQDGIITVVGEGGTLRLEADSQVRWYGEKGGSEVIPPVAMPFTDLAATLREFLAAIREGRKPETHLEDNVRTLAMVEAAIRSVETGQPVAVAPAGGGERCRSESLSSVQLTSIPAISRRRAATTFKQIGVFRHRLRLDADALRS